MVRYALAAALLTALPACGHDLPEFPVACTTKRGLELVLPADTPADEVSCLAFQQAEDAALWAFWVDVGWSPGLVSERINGYRVYIKFPGEKGQIAWYSPEHGYKVFGLCYCEYGAIVVSTDDWAENSLTHELAHAVERCGDPNHENWEANGILKAVETSHQVMRTVSPWTP